MFGLETETAGVFAAQVASWPTTLPDTPSAPPGTAVLLLNTRSWPTWLSPTKSADGPKNPSRAWLPVTIRSRPTVFAGSPFPAQMFADPEAERHRPVCDR